VYDQSIAPVLTVRAAIVSSRSTNAMPFDIAAYPGIELWVRMLQRWFPCVSSARNMPPGTVFFVDLRVACGGEDHMPSVVGVPMAP